MAVPTGYIKVTLLLTLPWALIAFLLTMVGFAAEESLTFSMIPYPLDWIITFAQIICFTVSGLLIGYMVIALLHG
jgi:hypothetical protein